MRTKQVARLFTTAGLVSAMFGSSLALPVQASAAEPTASKGVRPAALSAGPAAVDGGAVVAPSRPSGSFSNSPLLAPPAPAAVGKAPDVRGFEPGKSRLVARGLASETYDNPDGTQSVRLLSDRPNVEVAPGRFEPADLALTAASEADVPTAGRSGQPLKPGSKAKKHALAPVLGKDGTGGLFAAKTPEVGIRVSAVDDAPGRSAVALTGAPGVRLPGAAEGSDVELELTAGSVKETVVVANRVAANDGAWSFWVDVDRGGRLALNDRGGIDVRASTGQVAMVMPVPYINDSSAVPGQQEAADTNGTFALRQQGSRWMVTVQVPLAWLDDPARVWPVRVDPTTYRAGYIATKNYKTDGTFIDGGPMRTGSPQAWNHWRSVVDFVYEDWIWQPTQVVDVDATFQYHSGGTQWTDAHIQHATSFSYNGVGQYLGSGSLGAGEAYISTDGLSSFVRGLYDSNNTGAWFMIRGSEGSAYTYKGLVGELWVTLNRTANAPTLSAPANNAVGQSVEPTLTASASDPEGDQIYYYFRVSTNPNPDVNTVWNSGWNNTASSIKVPQGLLQGSTTYYWKVITRDYCHLPSSPCGYGRHRDASSGVFAFTTNRPPNPIDSNQASPATGLIADLRPTLTVPPTTDPDGTPLNYWFTIATGKDGKSGTVASSGWQSGTSWQVPAGVMRDGTAYSWTAWAWDGTSRDQASWSNRLTVDLRTGDPKSSPVDQAGPVTVNLANGNASVRADSPTAQFAKNSAGFGFTYNSHSATPNHGLTTTYYEDANRNLALDPDEQSKPLLQRLEAQVDQNWVDGTPFPGVVPADWFYAQWLGRLTVPTTGTYTFGTTNDDNALLIINGTQVRTAGCCAGQPVGYGTPITLQGGSSVSIRMDIAEATGAAYGGLWVKGPDGVEKVVPAEWLTPHEPAALPAGWTLSTDVDGSSPYVRAVVGDQGITLIDDSGASHVWPRQDGAAVTYQPPAGESGVLSVATAGAERGQLTLVEDDGARSVFAVDGKLLSYTPVDVTGKPAPLRYEWSGSRLSKITDSLSGLSLNLAYGDGSSTHCYADYETPANAAQAAPAGRLCRIDFPDGSKTQLFYFLSGGRLMQITDPGSEVTQFGYGANGRLETVRDPLTYDAIANGQAANDSSTLTALQYDNSTSGPGPRVTAVTSPQPKDANGTLQARPQRSYTYVAGAAGNTDGATEVRVAGLTPAPVNGWARRVTFNSRLQAVTDSDAAGAVTSTRYRADDLLDRTVDAAGRVSTTVYDSVDRPVASFGPAPAACFTDLQPVASPATTCGAAVPETRTRYDEGLIGLHTAWFNNTNLTGVPVLQATGFPGNSGAPLEPNYGSGAPAGITADSFSVRATGNLTFTATGQHTLKLNSDDGARLWIDDVLVADQWSIGANTPVLNYTVQGIAGNTVPIRVEWREDLGGAMLSVRWVLPGSGVESSIPLSSVNPGYNLVTSTTQVDSASTSGSVSSQTSATSYGAAPWEGLAQSTTVYPGGDPLTTHMRYDAEQRRTARALPAGNVDDPTARYTDSYYGPTETADNPCTSPAVETINQAGRLRTNTAPAAADGSQIVRENVYDIAGRVIASRTRTATLPSAEDWTCTSYDARGRVTQVKHGAYAVQPARTVSYNHAVGGNPLITSAGDGVGGIVTTSTDLLGRVVRYVDAHGVTTETAYDQAGRVTSSTTRRTSTEAPSSTQSFEYDSGGRLVRQKLNGLTLAAPTYNSAGETASVSYPAGTGNGGNGTGLTLDRDPNGRLKALTWQLAAGTVKDEVSRSQAGNVLTDVVTTTGTGLAAPMPASYKYDGAGRLTQAAVHRHRLSYAFTETGGCGQAVHAGKNTNRTSLIDTALAADGTAGASTTTTYCYDKADRLTAVAGGGVSAGGPDLMPGYDSHGNTTSLGDQALGYDGANRHLSTTVTGSGNVTYTRDATDRIIKRTSSMTGDATTYLYSYTGGGDAADLTLNSTGSSIVEQHISLPGGALYTHRFAGTGHVWSYPNVHGDLIVTATSTGAVTGQIATYDPYGQPIDQATGAIGRAGSPAADDRVPDSTSGQLDYGWLGQHQRPYEHAGMVATIEMGARQYVPALSRFLSVDPVEGGSSNDYDYTDANPVGGLDLDGLANMRDFGGGGRGGGGGRVKTGKAVAGRNGASVVSKGQRGVAYVNNRLRANGLKVTGPREVTLTVNGRTQTRHYDTSYIKPNGRTVYVEVKNGPRAARRASQRKFDEEMARRGRNVETWRVDVP